MRLSQITSDVIGESVKPSAPVVGGKINVELNDGSRGTIDELDLPEVLETGGRVIPEEEVKREAEFAEAGEKPVLASAVAAIRGATLGTSDILLKQTGLLSEQELQDLERANPTASIVGEVAGTVAPALLSGGAGLAGRAAVSKLVSQGMAKEAAELAVSKMGNSLVNKIAAASPSAIAESIGAIAGAKATGKLAETTSKVIKSAVNLGVGSAVEGALFGTGKLISEDQLGNAEFNAENLLATLGESAVLGGVLGGATSLAGSGLSAAYKGVIGNTKRQVVEKYLSEIDADDVFKQQLRDQIKNGDAIENGLLALKDPEIEKIKARLPDAPTTKGMESALKPVKNVENYLFDAPSLDGEAIRKSAQDLVNYVEKNVNEIWSGAKKATPEESGELIKQTFMSNINAPWQSGLAYYSDLMGEFGNKAVSQKFRTKLANEIKSSDAYRLAKEGPEIKRVLSILEDKKELLAKQDQELLDLGLNKRQIAEFRKDGGVSNKLNKELNSQGVNLREFNNTIARHAKDIPETELTLAQIKEMQSDIGAKLRVAVGSEKKLLRKAYDDLRGMMDGIIRESVGDSANAKKIIKGLDAANADYVKAYQAKDEIADLLGIKGAEFDDVLDKLQNASVYDLNKKFLNLKKADKAYEVLEKYPEIGKIVLATRQNELLNKHLLQNDVINYAGLKKTINKMSDAESLLYFGGDAKQKQKFLDLLTLYEKRPQTLNPSGTDIRRETGAVWLREALSPKKWLENWVLGDLYKGKESSIGKVLDTIVPGLNVVEKAANNGKVKISDAVEGFLQNVGKIAGKSALKYITGSTINNEKDIEDKVSYYSQNPTIIVENFARNNKDLFESAPKTAQAAQSRIIKAVEFLAQKAPKKDLSPFNDVEIPKSQLMKFKNYVEAVENPYLVIENLKSGYFTPEAGEAFKIVYPQMYEAIRQEFINRLPEFKLNEKQKGTISRILNIDSRKAYTPQGFQALQSSSLAQLKQDMAQPTRVSAGVKNLKQSNRTQTGLDRVLYRT